MNREQAPRIVPSKPGAILLKSGLCLDRDPDGSWAVFSIIGYERLLSPFEAAIADEFERCIADRRARILRAKVFGGPLVAMAVAWIMYALHLYTVCPR